MNDTLTLPPPVQRKFSIEEDERHEQSRCRFIPVFRV